VYAEGAYAEEEYTRNCLSIWLMVAGSGIKDSSKK
jgi:hypothetical protein